MSWISLAFVIASTATEQRWWGGLCQMSADPTAKNGSAKFNIPLHACGQ